MNPASLPDKVRPLLHAAGVLPVLTVNDVAESIAIARALLAGGLNTLEITLRTAAALDALREVKSALPQIMVGAGTVLDSSQVDAAIKAGADFLVTPGTPSTLAEALAEAPIPAIPGAATPTEIIALLQHGFGVMKLFPASILGGTAMLRALRGPFPNLCFCPTGGIREDDMAEYLGEANVVAIGGSWMVRPEWLATRNFDAIIASARRTRQRIDALRKTSN